MEQLNLKNAAAFGNSAFTKVDRAEALYEERVEQLYALGEDVAARVECPEKIAEALIKAAQAHVGRRGAYRIAEKALVTALRIVNQLAPADNARLVSIYKLLGHVCCRQGKHREAMKYNALALLLQMNPQKHSIWGCSNASPFRPLQKPDQEDVSDGTNELRSLLHRPATEVRCRNERSESELAQAIAQASS